MGRADRQSKMKDKRLKPMYFEMLCMTIFSLLIITLSDCKAADPSADYPSRPIEFVVHSAAGSASDMMGRLISNIIAKEKILSQPIVLSNKVGDGGGISMGYVFERVTKNPCKKY
jgi:putative tricarboxylic transport membrane protein